MSDGHAHTFFALPIQLADLKCNTCSEKDATALCIGCYGSFCVDCHKKHRQKIWTESSSSVYRHDTFKALFQSNSSESMMTTTASTRKFDPFDVLQQIDQWEEDLKTRVETTAEAARQNLRNYTDERYEDIFKRYLPIKENVRTKEAARRHIENKLPDIKRTLCDINDDIENLPSTMSIRFQSGRIDLTETMKIVATRSPNGISSMRRRPSTGHSVKTLEALDFGTLSQPPLKKITHLGVGMAIGASDKYIIYTDENDLCMIELSKDYRIVFPLECVVDICWCAEADYFVILTKRQVHTLNSNTKELHQINEIQSTSKSEFWRCTYASNTNTLLLCYGSCGSPIEEWKLGSPVKIKSWQVPQSCENNEFVQCIRVSSNGSCVALTVNDDEQDYFVIRDRAMQKMHRIPLRISDCLSFVSLPNNAWLLSILHYHKLFLIKNNYEVSKIIQTDAGKASTKGIAMMGASILAERTASTLFFFRL